MPNMNDPCYPPLSDQAMLVVDPRGTIEFSSHSANTLLDAVGRELKGKHLAGLMPQLPLRAATPGYNCAFLRFKYPPGCWHRIEVLPADAEAAIALEASFVFPTINGGARILIGLRQPQCCPDVEAQYRRFLSRLDAIDEVAVVTTTSGVIEYVNPAYERLSGWRREELVGQLRRPSELPESTDTGETERGICDTLRCEISKSGHMLYLDEQVRPFTDRSGRIIHLVNIARDVSRRIADEQGLLWRANFDSLTRIANRHALIQRLNQEIARASREDRGFTVICADMDRLKAVNDAFGHAAGDEAICAIAEQLQHCVREMDTVGRFGGDEFVVIVPGLSRDQDIDTLLGKLVTSVSSTHLNRAANISLSVSAGAAVYPRDGRDALSLLHAADSAMYRAKRRGGGHFVSTMAQPALLTPTTEPEGATLHTASPKMARRMVTLHQPRLG